MPDETRTTIVDPIAEAGKLAGLDPERITDLRGIMDAYPLQAVTVIGPLLKRIIADAARVKHLRGALAEQQAEALAAEAEAQERTDEAIMIKAKMAELQGMVDRLPTTPGGVTHAALTAAAERIGRPSGALIVLREAVGAKDLPALDALINAAAACEALIKKFDPPTCAVYQLLAEYRDRHTADAAELRAARETIKELNEMVLDQLARRNADVDKVAAALSAHQAADPQTKAGE